MNVTDQAIAFAKDLFHIYLEEQNFKQFQMMFNETVSWIGTGLQEVCKDHSAVNKLLWNEEPFWHAKFKILEQRYQANPINAEIVAVYGELELEEDSNTAALPLTRFRFSLVCKLCGSGFKVMHMHFSLANPLQKASMLIPKLAAQGDSSAQEEALYNADEDFVVSKARYEIAVRHTGAMIFDYIIASKQIVQPKAIAEKFGIPCTADGAVAAALWEKAVHPGSLKDFRRLYAHIERGEPSARATVLFTDVNNREVINDIFLTNIFSSDGKPVRAVGLMTDVTQTSELEREKQYQQAMNCNKLQSYDANITQDLVTYSNALWLEDLDLPRFQVFSEMIDYIGSKMVDIDHLEAFKNFFDRNSISAAYCSNKTQQIFQYRKREKNGCYNWVQSTMNIIRDEITQDIKVRCYMDIITEQKEKETKKAEEQRFYELLMTKSPLVYEANITKDMLIRGHEKWGTLYGIQFTSNYSSALEYLAAEVLHPDDVEAFYKVFLRENMLASFYAGERDSYCEYRRKDKSGNMIWVSCTTHIMEDTTTGDVLSFHYVLDINAEKSKELALVYKAEHDTLTGLYNKGVTEQKIDKCLKANDSKPLRHALFMFDIDRFKQINDNLGHAFGDGVLSQAARKIKDLFRKGDIIGRVGGDEFVVLMKNIPSHAKAVEKANQLCTAMREVYTRDDRQYHVSVSIGIAFYGEHGGAYKDLYKHADVALYAAKENGRNQYKVYDETMVATKSAIKSIDVSDLIEVKSFEKNTVEYIFRILYESSNKVSCINSVMDLIGKQYNISRVYIFEDSEDGLSTSNTFEWCSTGIAPQKDNLKNIAYSRLGNFKSRFNDQGIYFMAGTKVLPQNLRKILDPQEIKSMLHFAIIKGDKTRGFVGFDQCNSTRVPSKTEITELRSISNILGVFLLEMRAAAMLEATKNAAVSIVDGLDSYAYVIDRGSYRLLFVNESTKKISPNTRTGELCHKTFWKRNTPCDDCPMKNLEDHKTSKFSRDMYNPQFNVWVKATASWIDWIDGQRVCLLDSVDITAYK